MLEMWIFVHLKEVSTAYIYSSKKFSWIMIILNYTRSSETHPLNVIAP